MSLCCPFSLSIYNSRNLQGLLNTQTERRLPLKIYNSRNLQGLLNKDKTPWQPIIYNSRNLQGLLNLILKPILFTESTIVEIYKDY